MQYCPKGTPGINEQNMLKVKSYIGIVLANIDKIYTLNLQILIDF